MSLQYPEFKGKRALITGGTQGIGKAIAERLARQGATVYLNYVRNVQAAREALDQFRAAGYACELLQADLGSAEAVDAMLEQIHHFMRGAALALIEHGIRLNAADIGWTHTPGERRWFSEEEQNRLSRSIPIGRAAQADEIAAVVEFLLSEQASYVVGSLYTVDGGFFLRPNPST